MKEKPAADQQADLFNEAAHIKAELAETDFALFKAEEFAYIRHHSPQVANYLQGVFSDMVERSFREEAKHYLTGSLFAHKVWRAVKGGEPPCLDLKSSQQLGVREYGSPRSPVRKADQRALAAYAARLSDYGEAGEAWYKIAAELSFLYSRLGAAEMFLRLYDAEQAAAAGPTLKPNSSRKR